MSVFRQDEVRAAGMLLIVHSFNGVAYRVDQRSGWDLYTLWDCCYESIYSGPLWSYKKPEIVRCALYLAGFDQNTGLYLY
jgi:hypothetical protein